MSLTAPFIEEEVKKFMFQMQGDKGSRLRWIVCSLILAFLGHHQRRPPKAL
jgi:hypothetical protein